MRIKSYLICCLLFVGVFSPAYLLAEGAAASRPNIVVILADDLGYSDIGCYGSEIPTPHLDALAQNGLRFKNFYNSARCSPTRAALLTGLHPHQAGMGILAEVPGFPVDTSDKTPPGYRRVLGRDAVTLAEVLRKAGYHTYLAGKWHLGYHGQERWPLARGFDRFYGLVAGASSFFRPEEPRGLTLDNLPLPVPEGDYYITDAFTDYALTFLREQDDSEPFFLFLSYTAPHWPLHARDEDIERFVGTYRSGWDQIRKERLERQVSMGIMAPGTLLSPRDEDVRDWDSLSEQEQTELDYRMAVYAAQVYRMDWNIGRLIEFLRLEKALDNTLIFFLSDNGASAEPYTDLGGGEFANINASDEVMLAGVGRGGGSSYGSGWANVGSTPFRKHKSRLHEGGIVTPLIAHWPAGIKVAPGSITPALGYITDFMPTILEVTGASYPDQFNGVDIQPTVGKSLAPHFSADSSPSSTWLFWEQYDNKAVRFGDWKAVQPAEHGSPWELYDLEKDPTELTNLADQEADILERLTVAWQLWAEAHRVFPK
jgi:arylsulfatase